MNEKPSKQIKDGFRHFWAIFDSVKSETRQVWAQILFNNTYGTMEINGSEIESDVYFFET